MLQLHIQLPCLWLLAKQVQHACWQRVSFASALQLSLCWRVASSSVGLNEGIPAAAATPCHCHPPDGHRTPGRLRAPIAACRQCLHLGQAGKRLVASRPPAHNYLSSKTVGLCAHTAQRVQCHMPDTTMHLTPSFIPAQPVAYCMSACKGKETGISAHCYTQQHDTHFIQRWSKQQCVQCADRTCPG